MNLNSLNDWGHTFKALCIRLVNSPRVHQPELAKSTKIFIYCRNPAAIETKIASALERQHRRPDLPPLRFSYQIEAYKEFPESMLEDIEKLTWNYCTFPPDENLTDLPGAVSFLGVHNWGNLLDPYEPLNVFEIEVESHIDPKLLERWGITSQQIEEKHETVN